MSLGRLEWPEVGELVVTSVKDIKGYGAYVTLDEYQNKEGLLHISEISSRWVRNIRNHVRVGQKVVLQVLRVDQSRGQVDLSLRRVTGDERRKKIELWKKAKRAETLLHSAAANLGRDVEELYNEVGEKLILHYGSLYEGLEEAAKNGKMALIDAGLSEEMAEILAKIAEEKIIVKQVTIQGIVELSSTGRAGVDDLKSAFLEAGKIGDENDAEIRVYSLGSPKYRMEITADNYKEAETALEKIVNHIKDNWTTQNGTVSFTRE
jgi:translation initiation factor 2 subunit 1